MNVTGDELAGVVDLFGGLTRAELAEALAELGYRHGDEYDQTAYETDIEDAVDAYQLVALDSSTHDVDSDTSLLVPGPLAFPTLPDDARDLPHILDIEAREVAIEDGRGAVTEQFLAEAHNAIQADNTDRIETLLDASYELEAWADIDLSDVRSELAAATPTN